MKQVLLLFALLLVVIQAKVYFSETFEDGTMDRWTVSNFKQEEGQAGKWEVAHGQYFGDEAYDTGLKTTEDYRFYAISAPLDEDFSNEGKTLVVQYSVKHEQNIDCGGGYLKILPAGLDQENFGGDSEYNIMFGPDICGSSTRRVHLIFNYNGENHLIKENVACETDEFSHLYTLILNSDNTYEIRIDNAEKRSGKLDEDWDMLPPKKINDPDVSKPADWVDEKKIRDPEDEKPEGWDDIPAEIPDPDATKPDDWDDDLDGDWEAPTIPNPDYKGPWTPRMIDNPDYKGEWVHPQIDNPEYEYDPNLYKFDSNAFIGIEVWQVKAGTIFGNFLVTDSVEEAEEAAEAFLEQQKAERTAYDEAKAEEEAQRAAEAEANAEDNAEEEDDLADEELEDEEIMKEYAEDEDVKEDL